MLVKAILRLLERIQSFVENNSSLILLKIINLIRFLQGNDLTSIEPDTFGDLSSLGEM